VREILHNSCNIGGAEIVCLPRDVVDIIACVPSLPQPPTYYVLRRLSRTGEVFRNVPRRFHLEVVALLVLVWCPSESTWGTGHEVRIPVAHRAREVNPIVLFGDVIRASNLHPSLATVINGESDLEVKVLAWHKCWYSHSRRVVQVLPILEAESGIDVVGSA
jgi:hypothetical protein